MADENIYQTIIENSPLATAYNKVVLGEDGKKDYVIIRANRAFKAIIGLEDGEISNKRVSKLKSNLKSADELKKCFDEVTLDGASKDYRKYFIRPHTYCNIKVSFLNKEEFIVYVSECELSSGNLSDYLKSERRIQQVFDNVETQIWNLIDPITYGYANKAHADFFGLRVEDMEFKNIYDFLNKEEANVCYIGNENVYKSKSPIITEELIVNSNNEKRLLKTTKTPILDNEDNVEMVICMAEDITEIKELEAMKKLKEDILYAMIDFTNELLTNKDYNNALYKGIAKIGQATKVDRVYYWENHLNQNDNKWYTSQRFEWTNDGVTPQVDNPLLQNVPFEEVWDFVDILSKSEHFNFHVKDIENEFTREFLKMQDVLSILVLPVIIEGVFRGFMGFDSTKEEKDWSEIEISLLHSFVLLYKKSIERHILEEEIIKANSNFDNLINTIPEILTVLDKNGNIIYANQSLYDRLGYTKEEIVGKNALSLHPEFLRKAISKNIQDMMEGKRVYSSVPIISKSGEIINLETRITRGIWNGDQALFSVTKDVTDLKMSEEKFYKAFNNSGVSMFITTLEEGKILEANDGFLNIIGLDREDVIGKTTEEINLYVNPSERDNILKKIIVDKRISRKEIMIQGKDGKIIDGEFNVVPVNINKEQCLLASVFDMTKYNQMIKKLSKAKEESDIANKAKSEFLSHMSHEIRTPMNAVVAYSDLLLLTNLSFKQYSYVNGIKSSSKILMSMINDTLDWGKIENTGLELENIAFNLNDILESVITQIKFKSLANGIDIIIEKEDDVPNFISGDPLRLQQVLLNLLSNAVKFTGKGEIRIGLKKIHSDQTTVELEFSISDTGIGISKENIKAIFEPFKQASNVLDYKTGGTGLGLAISKKIVEKMGGSIRVKSEIGLGSTFTFNGLFDLKNGNDIDPHYNYVKDFTKKIMLDLGKNKNIKVLVVDDNEINQDVLREILENAEMNVTVVDSGAKAIEEVKALRFDIVLLDLRMPYMDGYETISRIRQFLTYDQLPIIAVTASVSLEEKEKTIIAGFNEYLIKPIDKNKLIELINKLTNKSKLREDEKIPLKTRSGNFNYGDLKNIMEIDLRECLSHFNNDQEFLIKILRKFYSNHKDSVTEIKEALKEGDLTNASRIAHTLKGIAGELKAYEIYKLAASLEKDILDKKNVDKALIKLEKKLDSLCGSINKINYEVSNNLIGDDPDSNNLDLIEEIKRLEELLKDSDLDALKIVENLDFSTKGKDINEKIKALKGYCEYYDFDIALEMLEDIKKTTREG